MNAPNSSPRVRSLFALPLLALLLAAGAGCGSTPKSLEGKRYASAAEFRADVTRLKYAIIGEFDEAWPATVVRVTEGLGGVELVLPGRPPHDYSGFDGYRMAAVVLKPEEGGSSGFVLRAESK